MDYQKIMVELIKKAAVLEYRIQKQHENIKVFKEGLDEIEKILEQIKANTFDMEID